GARTARAVAWNIAQPGREPCLDTAPARRPRSEMALSRAHLCLVDPLAPGVTNQRLVSLPAFMRFLRLLVFLPVWLLVVAAQSDTTPSPTTTPSANTTPSPP